MPLPQPPPLKMRGLSNRIARPSLRSGRGLGEGVSYTPLRCDNRLMNPRAPFPTQPFFAMRVGQPLFELKTLCQVCQRSAPEDPR